jgi:hypothetical protein
LKINICILAEHLRASAASPTALAPPIAVILRESGVSSTPWPINFFARIEIAYHANANAIRIYTTPSLRAKRSNPDFAPWQKLDCFASLAMTMG